MQPTCECVPTAVVFAIGLRAAATLTSPAQAQSNAAKRNDTNGALKDTSYSMNIHIYRYIIMSMNAFNDHIHARINVLLGKSDSATQRQKASMP